MAYSGSCISTSKHLFLRLIARMLIVYQQNYYFHGWVTHQHDRIMSFIS